MLQYSRVYLFLFFLSGSYKHIENNSLKDFSQKKKKLWIL